MRIKRHLKRLVKYDKDFELKNRSLFLFGPQNNFRIWLYRIISTRLYEYLVYAAIIASCIVVIIGTDDDQNHEKHTNSNTICPTRVTDIATNAIFVLEAVMKIIACGFVVHRTAYLRRDGWNIFDFTIVLGAVINDIYALTTQTQQTAGIKSLRLLRVLRPLRFISKSENLKIVLDTVVTSFKTILNVLLFIFVILILFSVIGMELFMGVMHSACFNSTTKVELVPYTMCNIKAKNLTLECRAGAFCQETNDLSSFDNILLALLTTLQVITMDDWVFVLYKLADATSSWLAWLFFVALIMFGGYFAIDLLMGVLGNQYMRNKKTIKYHNKIRKAKLSVLGEMAPNLQKSRVPKWLRKMVKTLRKNCRNIIRREEFFFVNKIIIFFDVMVTTVYVSLEETKTSKSVYTKLKLCLVPLYLLDNLVELCANGMWKCWSNNMYMLKTINLIAVIAEFFIWFLLDDYNFIGFSTVQGVGLLMILKYTRIWKALSTILNSFKRSIQGVLGLVGLLTVILLIYALLGHQWFAMDNHDMTDDEHATELLVSFDTFQGALLLSFALLTGDNWSGIMKHTVSYLKGYTRWLAVVYFVSYVLLGYFVLMNIFLGIIVDNLTNDFDDLSPVDEEASIKWKMLKNVGALGLKVKQLEEDTNKTLAINSEANKVNTDTDVAKQTDTKTMVCCGKCRFGKKVDNYSGPSKQDSRANLEGVASFIENTIRNTTTVRFDLEDYHQEVHYRDRDLSISAGQHRQLRMRRFSLLIDPDILQPIPQHRALYLFDENNEFRQHVFTLVTSTKFTVFIALMICASSAAMAFRNPMKNDPDHVKLIHYFDYGFTAIFTVEVILKAIAYGFVLGHRNCYLRDPMNALDLLTVLTSIVSILLINLGSTDRLGIMRMFRILRMLNLSETIKSARNAVWNSIQNIGYLMVLIMFFMYIFVLCGVTMYRDQLGTCILPPNSTTKATTTITTTITTSTTNHSHRHLVQDTRKAYSEPLILNLSMPPSAKKVRRQRRANHDHDNHQQTKNNVTNTTTPQYRTKSVCVQVNGTWKPNGFNFDSIRLALIHLISLGSMDDWVKYMEILYNVEGRWGAMSIFYVVTTVFVFGIFVMNVLVGFIIICFHKEKEKEEKCKVLDKAAQECISAALNDFKLIKGYATLGTVRHKAWIIVTSVTFEHVSLMIIILNTLVMVLRSYQQSSGMDEFHRIANITFTIIFTAELIFKFYALTLAGFLHDHWCIFDAFVVIGSWVDIILTEMNLDNFINLSLLRLFRVARLAKIIGKDENLKQLFYTFIHSMQSVPAIASLLTMQIYLYAIIGMELFGKIRLDDDTPINRHANFQSFGSAMQILLRLTTQDAWGEVMIACADTTSHNCQVGLGNCGSEWAYTYFLSFQFICANIMTNLFLAVIMENFVYLVNDAATLDLRHIHRFLSSWEHYDELGTGKIRVDQIVHLLRSVDPPLGCGKLCPKRNVYSKLLRLKVPQDDDGYVHFEELLFILVLDALNLPYKAKYIREDVLIVAPNISDSLLERVFPFENEPKLPLTPLELQFRVRCAAMIIIGYYRMFKSGRARLGQIMGIKNKLKTAFRTKKKSQEEDA